ncbi:RDD family protein [Rhodoblastus sp.]|uniref:RDD family protein n=1 Tax=Rhodoblastus sp. TaxID=1962975 RepID=UPI0035B4B88B
MSNANSWGAPRPAVYPLAPLPASALAGVRRRRIAAVLLDLILVSILSAVLFIVLGVLTLGIAWLFLPSLFPLVAFFYNGLTISGWRRATPGMKAMDLEMRLVDGSPTPFIHASVHAVLFYLSLYLFAPIFLFSLFASDKRCLHDVLAGVIVLRRV